jgi:RecA-family ATPase
MKNDEKEKTDFEKRSDFFFPLAFQRKFLAYLMMNEEKMEKYHKLIKPEDFEYGYIAAIARASFQHYKEFHKIPDWADIELRIKRTEHREFPIEKCKEEYKEILKLEAKDGIDFGLVEREAIRRIKAGKIHQKFMNLHEYTEKDFENLAREIEEIRFIGDQSSGLISLADIQPEKVEWLWPNRIPAGKFSLLVGDPGAGKSFFTIFLASQISRGRAWPDDLDKNAEIGKVLLLSAEDSPKDTIRPRADWAGADVSKIDILECSRDKAGNLRPFNLTQDIYHLEEMLKKDSAYRLVIIDPLSAYVGRIDTHRDSEVRFTLAPLTYLAEKYNVAVLGVLHFNKNTTLQAVYRILGSIGFIAAARTVWLIAKDRDDEDEKRRFFAPIKNNLAPPAKALAFYIERGGLIFEKAPLENFDIEEVLAPMERASETKRAKEFLLDVLRNGPMLMKEIKNAAREEGVSWGTLRRAKERMNIKSFKEGGVGGKWFWKLEEVDRLTRLAEEDAEIREKEDEHEVSEGERAAEATAEEETSS